MTLSNDDLYRADMVEIRFLSEADVARAAGKPELAGILPGLLSGAGAARVVTGLVHELRSHLQALGIDHEERAAA